MHSQMDIFDCFERILDSQKSEGEESFFLRIQMQEGDALQMLLRWEELFYIVSARTVSKTPYPSQSSEKSSPSQNRQLDILISNNKQLVVDLVGELTF